MPTRKCDRHYDWFLSHTQRSGEFQIGVLSRELKMRGQRVWVDTDRDLNPNYPQMLDGIRRSDVFVFFLSKDIFKKSYFARLELECAVRERKPIFLLIERGNENLKFDGKWDGPFAPWFKHAAKKCFVRAAMKTKDTDVDNIMKKMLTEEDGTPLPLTPGTGTTSWFPFTRH